MILILILILYFTNHYSYCTPELDTKPSPSLNHSHHRYPSLDPIYNLILSISLATEFSCWGHEELSIDYKTPLYILVWIQLNQFAAKKREIHHFVWNEELQISNKRNYIQWSVELISVRILKNQSFNHRLIISPPPRIFSSVPKTKQKQSDKSHLRNLNYILCGHFDEHNFGVPPSGGVG